MSDNKRLLPLFPLNVVLFPNSVLPLHVFEERYRLMVQRCLDGDSEFGVVLIKSGSDVGEPAEPHSVGTVARIMDVDRLEDGRMLLSVAGRGRFRIEEVTQLAPYLEGEVVALAEEAEEEIAAEELDAIHTAVSDYVRVLMGLSGGWVKETQTPEDPVTLSYFIGSLLQVDLAEKQALLEAPSVAGRLATERNILDREVAALRERVKTEMRLKLYTGQ